jgi:hypothetical protein
LEFPDIFFLSAKGSCEKKIENLWLGSINHWENYCVENKLLSFISKEDIRAW